MRSLPLGFGHGNHTYHALVGLHKILQDAPSLCLHPHLTCTNSFLDLNVLEA